jgi:hypothetical protein
LRAFLLAGGSLIGCRCQFLIGKTPWPPPLGQKRSDALIVTGTQGASQIHVARSHNLHPHFRRSRRRLAVGSMDWWPRERRLHFRHCLRDRGSLHCALRNYCRNWIGDFQCIQRQIVRVGIIAIPNCQKIETAGKTPSTAAFAFKTGPRKYGLHVAGFAITGAAAACSKPTARTWGKFSFAKDSPAHLCVAITNARSASHGVHRPAHIVCSKMAARSAPTARWRTAGGRVLRCPNRSARRTSTDREPEMNSTDTAIRSWCPHLGQFFWQLRAPSRRGFFVSRVEKTQSRSEPRAKTA